jgi:hypothetical protein
MSEQQKNSENKPKTGRNRKSIVMLILMFLLLITLFIVQCHLSDIRENALRNQAAASDSLNRINHLQDSLLQAEQLRIADSIRVDSIRRADSARIADSLSILSTRGSQKPKAQTTIQDSSTSQKGTTLTPKGPIDSIPPEASIVPPSGRYYEPIALKVQCNEIHCTTYLSIGDTLHSVEAAQPIDYNKTGDVFFRAQDSAGNFSPWQTSHYDMASDNVCGKNAYPVPVGGKNVCVDAYEYPNEADALPKDMVSHEQATRLCEQAGKRLCAINEWQAACRGKDNLRYSYGGSYNQTKCNTNTKAAKRAGRKEQCRSWYGMYDMNGNLWEWTSTPSRERNTLYLVAGGAWDTNNGSSCSESKFSFYPQNQYNFVGFRCCQDAR